MVGGSRIWGRSMLAAVFGAALVVAGCGASGGAASPSAAAPSPAPPAEPPQGEATTVMFATDATLGDILVDPDGKTLYVFTKDAGGKSVCNGDCAAAWPPLLVADGAAPAAGEGVTGALGTITRDDGTTQVTFGGAPLYYFAADAGAGDVKGQGVNDVWFVVSPSGSIVKPSGAAGPSPTTGDDDYSRGGSSPTTEPAAGAGSSTASIEGFAFAPAILSVPVGTTVTWTNSDSTPHTVTADDGGFASGRLAAGEAFSQSFPEPGTYTYHCAVHPRMVGSVVVTP